MKLIEPMKKVDYFGIELIVPQSTKAIATDENGAVFAYEESNGVLESPYTEVWICETGDYKMIAEVDLEDTDWKETKVEYL